ncbi:hypothetical protein CSUI_003787 [Cystoisospora suis]|uniref:Transmembrane protein n=1 Tax=Cystoisospora suis TaxID=483139 RepID=A0A2C6L437_9APIC|nr:hypothetical protein CSUI_003787 [Cystoisospora suis]
MCGNLEILTLARYGNFPRFSFVHVEFLHSSPPGCGRSFLTLFLSLSLIAGGCACILWDTPEYKPRQKLVLWVQRREVPWSFTAVLDPRYEKKTSFVVSYLESFTSY